MPGYLLHHLLDAGQRDGARMALRHQGHAMDYATFSSQVDACAGALKNVGLCRGDRVAILLEKGAAECWAIFGASRADGVFVPINPALRPQQIRHLLDDCGARILLTSSELSAPLLPFLDGVPSLEAVISIDGADKTEGAGVPMFSFQQAAAGATPPTNAAIGEDLSAILYTSGSTGLPKGVMLSHRNLLAGTRIVRTYLDITAEDRILSILPLSFDYGLNQLLTAVEQSACLIPLTFRFGDEVVAALSDHSVTGLAGVPSLWAILTRATPSLPKVALPHLRYITNSGGAVPTATVRRLRELLPQTKVVLMYGLTEAFRSTYLPPDEIDRRPHSIGKAVPESEIFLVDETGALVPPDKAGILVHRGPTVSLGYWNKPEETAAVLRPNPLRPLATGGDIVCVSGDLAERDEDGFFYFLGRQDAMIKSSGHRISPTEVEEALMVSGQFRQVAVVGLPDPIVGQRVHAVAVPDRPDIDTRHALEQCAELLAAYMVPRSIELVEALPLSANGKIDYKALVRERVRDVG